MASRFRKHFDSLKGKVDRRVRAGLERAVAQAEASARAVREQSALAPIPKSNADLEAADAELPVVARLVVEIRSDGSRTVARGALKDELGGEQVAIVARGESPLQLAAQLSKSLLTMPFAAGQIAKAMLEAKRGRRDDDE